MDFDYSPRQRELMRRIGDFMDEHVYPAVPIYEQQAAEGERWKVIPILEQLKAKARASRAGAAAAGQRGLEPVRRRLRDARRGAHALRRDRLPDEYQRQLTDHLTL